MVIFKSKTFWAGLGGVAAAGAGYAAGEFSTAESIQTALLGIISIFLRLGVEKSGLR